MRAWSLVLTLLIGCSAFGAGDEDKESDLPATAPVTLDAGDAGDAATSTNDGAAPDAGNSVFNVPCSDGKACTSPDQVCCNYVCGPASTCASSTVFQCNDAEDCAASGKAGMVCCMNRSNSVVYNTACRTSCAVDEERACNLAGGDEQCEPGKHCVSGLSANGYGHCL